MIEEKINNEPPQIPSTNLETNLLIELPSQLPVKKDNSFKVIYNAFVNSNFLKPVLIGVLSILFLSVLVFFVFKNLGTTGTSGEIIWWGIEHDKSVYAPLISEFEKQNPKIRIKYEKQSTQDYRERLQNALSTGKGPDIFEIHNSWPSMLKTHLSKMPSSIFSLDEYKKAFYPVIYSNFNLGGGIVAIPFEYDAITLYVNEEIFASGAKTPPLTWDELRDLSVSLTQRDGRGSIIQAGASLGVTNNIDYWQDTLALMMVQNHVNPIKPTGTFAEDVLTFYTLFNKKSWDDSLPPSTEAFSKGKLAMYFGPSREASNIVKLNNKLRFKTVNLPQLPKNTPQDSDFSIATYWGQSVYAKSKKSKEAWQFLKFMSSEDSLKKINSNIEKSETFSRVYPRPSMNETMREDSLLGSIISLADSSTSSFLSDKTYDGTNGVNSKVSKLYGEIVESWKGKGSPGIINSLNKDITQVLSEFGISNK